MLQRSTGTGETLEQWESRWESAFLRPPHVPTQQEANEHIDQYMAKYGRPLYYSDVRNTSEPSDDNETGARWRAIEIAFMNRITAFQNRVKLMRGGEVRTNINWESVDWSDMPDQMRDQFLDRAITRVKSHTPTEWYNIIIWKTPTSHNIEENIIAAINNGEEPYNFPPDPDTSIFTSQHDRDIIKKFYQPERDGILVINFAMVEWYLTVDASRLTLSQRAHWAAYFQILPQSLARMGIARSKEYINDNKVAIGAGVAASAIVPMAIGVGIFVIIPAVASGLRNKISNKIENS